MSFGAIGTAVAGGVASAGVNKLLSDDGGGGSTISQQPMITKKQKEMQDLLASFAKTGKWGDTGYQLGTGYPGMAGLLDTFTPTDVEAAGQNKLEGLIERGMPKMWDIGAGEVEDLLTTDKYDPYAKGGIYQGFKKNILEESEEAADRLKRNQAIQGSLYSKETGEQLGELEEATHQTLSNKLAELYQDFSDKKIAGARTAANLGIQEEETMKDRIELTQELGSLERLLNQARAKSKYSEWMRQNEDWMKSISAAKSLWNRNTPYGVKDYTYESSPLGNILGGGASKAIGYGLGGKLSSAIENMLLPAPATSGIM